MQAEVRKKLTMAHAVLDFMQSHTTTDSGTVAAVTALQDGLARADLLANQQQSGTVDEHDANRRRIALRRQLQVEHISHLARIGAKAAAADPTLAGTFVPPRSALANLPWATAAHRLLTAATAQKAVLVPLGLGDTFLDDFTASLAAFDASIQISHRGHSDHVGARADLHAVADQCVHDVLVLDGLNRIRFRDDPELLAAWQGALHGSGPFRTRRSTGAAPVTSAPVPGPKPEAPLAGGATAAS